MTPDFPRTPAPHGRLARSALAAIALGTALAFGLAADVRADTAAQAPPPEATLAPAPLAVFSASNPRVGVEPWITDGTTAGTRLLRNIGRDGNQPHEIRSSSFPRYFTALGDGRVIFTAIPRRLTGLQTLFVTDGTREGTQIIRLIDYPSHLRGPHDLTALGDGRALFRMFRAGGRVGLLVTDGTREGTNQIAVWDDGAPGQLAALGDGRALFTGRFDVTDGREFVWITDGTRRGTQVIKEINPGSFLGGTPREFTALGDGRALFSANDGVHGNELWITDSTTEGTRMVRDIRAGGPGSYPRDFTPIGGGRAIFSAEDPYRELYVTDGTEAGTQLLREFWTGVGSGNPEWFAPLGNGNFLFAARTREHGRELWRTDGTPRGTRLVQNINRDGSSHPTHITPLGDGRAVFWVSNDPRSNDFAMWVSDGTRAGTERVRLFPGVFHARHHLATLGDGRALFVFDNGRTGWEPWVTDGTREGTHLLRNIHRTGQSDPREFTAFTPAPPGEPLADAD